MSNEAKKGALFIKQVVARIKGDDAEVLGTKIARKALSAVEGQIAALNSKKVDIEGEVEDAKEALTAAKYPDTMITSNSGYIDGIKRAQETLDAKSADLADIEASIKYFTELLASF